MESEKKKKKVPITYRIKSFSCWVLDISLDLISFGIGGIAHSKKKAQAS